MLFGDWWNCLFLMLLPLVTLLMATKITHAYKFKFTPLHPRQSEYSIRW